MPADLGCIGIRGSPLRGGPIGPYLEGRFITRNILYGVNCSSRHCKKLYSKLLEKEEMQNKDSKEITQNCKKLTNLIYKERMC